MHGNSERAVNDDITQNGKQLCAIIKLYGIYANECKSKSTNISDATSIFYAVHQHCKFESWLPFEQDGRTVYWSRVPP